LAGLVVGAEAVGGDSQNGSNGGVVLSGEALELGVGVVG
jgi:hypothetical protein